MTVVPTVETEVIRLDFVMYEPFVDPKTAVVVAVILVFVARQENRCQHARMR